MSGYFAGVVSALFEITLEVNLWLLNDLSDHDKTKEIVKAERRGMGITICSRSVQDRRNV